MATEKHQRKSLLAYGFFIMIVLVSNYYMATLVDRFGHGYSLPQIPDFSELFTPIYILFKTWCLPFLVVWPLLIRGYYSKQFVATKRSS